jgi:hypothetical protein
MPFDRKKPGVAFWATVVVAALVVYVLSMPIALTLSDLPWVPRWIQNDVVATIYGPLFKLLSWLSPDDSL